MNKQTNYNHPILAKEGLPFIIAAIIVTIIAIKLNMFFAIIMILLTIFIIQFFRDPKRMITNQTDVIIAPADGKVICIEKAYDEYQKVEALKISIFMNVFNVHSNRSPANGVVVDTQYFKGSFVNADFDKASVENERNAVILQLENTDKITFVQVAGLIARRILCHTQKGAILTAGCRYGFIRFGSRVDLYLPLTYQPVVSIGDKVSAATSIIAKIR